MTKVTFAGSNYTEGNRFAEVQVLREINTDPDMYESVASTTLEVLNESSNGIYSVTCQMAFEQNDVLGVLLPNDQVQLRLLFTDEGNSTGYYIAVAESPRPQRIPLAIEVNNVLPLIQVKISK